MNYRSVNKLFVLFLPLSFLFLFLILPLINLLFLSLTLNKQISLDNFLRVITHPLNAYFFIWDVKQALITTFLSIIIGLPFSYALVKYNIPGKIFIKSLITIPFLLPPIVVLMSFITVFGTGGWINEFWQSIFSSPLIKIYGTTEGIILAHLFYNIPVIIRLTESGFASINPELEIVSKSLGVSRLRYLIKIELPHVFPALLTASLLVFIYSFNSFAIVLILGGVQFQTLEVRIFNLAKYSFDYNQAAALTMIQLLFNIVVIIAYIYLSSKNERPLQSFSKVQHNFRRSINKIDLYHVFRFLFFAFVFIIVTVISVLPLIGLFFRSLLDRSGDLTLNNYYNLFNDTIRSFVGLQPVQMIINTLSFGILVLIISLILSLLLNYGLHYKTTYKRTPKLDMRHLTGMIVFLPLIISSISLAFSIFSLYRTSFIYENTGLIIVIVHVLIAFPFANRIIASARANIDRNYITIGRSLGLSRTLAFFKIEIPLLFPYIIVAGLFSLAISIGEFGATNFISKTNFATIPVGIYRLINSRNIGEASAFSVILIVLTLILFLFIERIGKYDYKL